MSGRPTIVWFRRDLRLSDNPALTAAALKGGPVIPVYLADWQRGDLWAPGAAARWWLGASLSRLAEDLARWGAPLRIVEGEPVSALAGLARATGTGEVVWNCLHEPFGRELSRRVEASLRDSGVASRDLAGGLLFEPEEHLSRAGRPFVQFGAFWRSCQSLPEPAEPGGRPAGVSGASPGLDFRPLASMIDAVSTPTVWSPGVSDLADPWEPGDSFDRREVPGYPVSRQSLSDEPLQPLSGSLFSRLPGIGQV
jgi:deoxyribodipyrimidine photo-lyase